MVSHDFPLMYFGDITLLLMSEAGAGKTIITYLPFFSSILSILTVFRSLAIEALMSSSDSPLTLFYYCHYADKFGKVDILATLLGQALQRTSYIGPYPISLLGYQDDQFCPTEEDIVICLKNIIDQHSRVFILVDSIHEVVDSLKLVLLGTLRDLSISGASIFVTSRSTPDVQYFRSGSFESLKIAEVKIFAHPEDICKYVKSAIIANHKLSRLVDKFSDLQEKIESGIIDGADHLYVIPPILCIFIKYFL
jgi:hypothetical protein